MDKKILDLLCEQIEDQGLWFEATYASEAYVQNALRKLHAVIEQVIQEEDDADV